MIIHYEVTNANNKTMRFDSALLCLLYGIYHRYFYGKYANMKEVVDTPLSQQQECDP